MTNRCEKTMYLDGDASLLLVLTGIGVAGLACSLASDNTGLADEGIGQLLINWDCVTVDFPWSTWAMTDMFLMLSCLSMISLI